jgi:hypothetical protein
MRRVLFSLLLVASTLGLAAVPAGAVMSVPDGTKVHLSFDFSDNSDAASASGGAFNIITDVLPEHTPGVVRMVAIAPADSGLPSIVCRYQDVTDSQVECGFNFTVSGTWEIKSQFAVNRSADVLATAVTNINVSD